MFEVTCPALLRVARTQRIERAFGSACAIDTKLYCPPTPLTTRPSSSPSETAAPSSVTIIVVLTKREWRRCRMRSSWSAP